MKDKTYFFITANNTENFDNIYRKSSNGLTVWIIVNEGIIIVNIVFLKATIIVSLMLWKQTSYSDNTKIIYLKIENIQMLI